MRSTLKLVTPGLEVRMLRKTSEVRKGAVFVAITWLAEVSVLVI